MAQSVQQVGANFILFEGFDVLFSLLGEFTKNATSDMKNQGKGEQAPNKVLPYVQEVVTQKMV